VPQRSTCWQGGGTLWIAYRSVRTVTALDGLQPDVGHEVLWVLRDCLSGEVLLARSLLSASETDLATLLHKVHQSLPVPIRGVISDGRHSIRNAVHAALPDVPHQLCHFHSLREAAKSVYEADRHAKKELKKHIRGVRLIDPSSVKFVGFSRDRLLETTPGRAFIRFVASRKHYDIPGIEPDLTEEGSDNQQSIDE
jgi:hypothetical protein